MTEPLPHFVYHPDPVASGSISESSETCECCGRARGYRYAGSYYSHHEVCVICPWCIGDGSAHEKHDIEFTERSRIGDDGTWGTVPDDVADMVAYRTPGFMSRERGRWWVCCGDAAVFLSRADKAGLEAYGVIAVEVIRRESGLDGDEWQRYLEAFDQEHGSTAYVFRCRHCGKLGGYSDSDREDGTSSLQIDLSGAMSADDIHAALAGALGFPDGHGHNWDAFWELVTSDHPLPDRLTIRGLDHIERALPREAELMLACVREYNNSGRLCSLVVTNDYETRMFFLRYEARPTKDAERQDVVGASVTCWIKADSAREANQIATKKIDAYGWKVISHDELAPVSLNDLASAEDDSFIRQACVDGAVFHFHSWLSEE